jgi:hypothetical protein
VQVHIVVKSSLLGVGQSIGPVYADEVEALRAANDSHLARVETHEVIGMESEDTEVRGGEKPADWRGPADVTPDPLPKGGEPAGVPEEIPAAKSLNAFWPRQGRKPEGTL